MTEVYVLALKHYDYDMDYSDCDYPHEMENMVDSREDGWPVLVDNDFLLLGVFSNRDAAFAFAQNHYVTDSRYTDWINCCSEEEMVVEWREWGQGGWAADLVESDHYIVKRFTIRES